MKATTKNVLKYTAKTLLVVGGINWGLIGFFNYNLVETFITWAWVQKTIYAAVGIAAVYEVIRMFNKKL